MKDAALLASPLFRGATSEEIAAMLPCLGASPRRFARGERILRAGSLRGIWDWCSRGAS